MVQCHAKSLRKQAHGRNQAISNFLAHVPSITDFSAENAMEHFCRLRNGRLILLIINVIRIDF